MGYAFASDDRTAGAALRRIADEQLGRGIAALSEKDADTLHDRIHEARKSAKKLRGLARLVRPAFPAYSDVNERLRDAARHLSPIRDRTAVIESLDRIVAGVGKEVDTEGLKPLRAALEARRDEAARAPDLPDRIATFRDTLQVLTVEVRHWDLDSKGFGAIAGGLAKTYGRARTALDTAEAEPTPEQLHDWRKRVKYHWYHTRLLCPIWPEMMVPHRDAADRLADALGRHRDLVTFEPLLSDGDLPKRARKLLAPLVTSRSDAIVSDAFVLGRRLLADEPDALAARWRAWWKLWRKG
ncbi:CHAD domain-containing protein [Rhodobacterales bacterium HKCCE2091]|nr:CHAD domain-containing protein [Rhodobacterales bacterium HKCCE2091]